MLSDCAVHLWEAGEEFRAYSARLYRRDCDSLRAAARRCRAVSATPSLPSLIQSHDRVALCRDLMSPNPCQVAARQDFPLRSESIREATWTDLQIENRLRSAALHQSH